MKKLLFILIFFVFATSSASASEIFGQISTNPKAPSGEQTNPPTEEPIEETPVATRSTPIAENRGGAVILPAQVNLSAVSQQSVQVEEIRADALKSVPSLRAEVLGVKIYPDNTLLRSSDHKIYIIQGRVKKYVASLKELEKYRGQVILDALAEELSGYQTRGYLDGKLIRQRGDVKVYVIVKGQKRHILNLEELRAHYFGLKIFNINREEMSLY